MFILYHNLLLKFNHSYLYYSLFLPISFFIWHFFYNKWLIQHGGVYVKKIYRWRISNEELETIINPFYDNYHNYVEEYVMPEVIAFYIASSFYRNAMWEATFLQHYNSTSDMFNLYDEDYEKTKTEVIKLLRIKYSLEIISEDPLDLKKIEY